MMMNKCCNKNCCEVCTDFNLNDIIYKANYEISKLSVDHINSKKYGFECKKDVLFLINKISIQKWVLENVHKFKRCICDSDINIIKEDLTYNVNCNVTPKTELTEEEQYVLNEWNRSNPYCVSRESWEALSHKVCGSLSMEVSIKEMCNFTYDLYVRNFNCDFVSSLSVYSNSCQFNYQTDIYSKQQCKYHYDKLVKVNKNCDLTLSKYSKLLNTCNLRPSIISEGYSCGFKFDIAGKCPILKSPKNQYDLCNMKFNKILYDVNCDLMNEKANIKTVLKEYKIN